MEDTLNSLISDNKVIIFSKDWCPFCRRAISILKNGGLDPKVIDLDKSSDGDEIHTALKNYINRTSVPQTFIGGEYVGG